MQPHLQAMKTETKSNIPRRFKKIQEAGMTYFHVLSLHKEISNSLLNMKCSLHHPSSYNDPTYKKENSKILVFVPNPVNYNTIRIDINWRVYQLLYIYMYIIINIIIIIIDIILYIVRICQLEGLISPVL